jgi:hypothetical protein
MPLTYVDRIRRLPVTRADVERPDLVKTYFTTNDFIEEADAAIALKAFDRMNGHDLYARRFPAALR